MGVLSYEDSGERDENEQEYRDEDGDDIFGGYRQDSDEESDSIRVKRFEIKPTIKTLSPLEIRDVRDAIQQILSGYNQNNPLTPLPQTQVSNEKKSIENNRPIHKTRSASPLVDNYYFNARTQVDEYDDVTDNKTEAQTVTANEPLTAAKPLETSTKTKDENYEAESNYLIYSTINSLSFIPVTSNTEDILKADNRNYAEDEIVSDDVRIETPVTNVHETETNIGYPTINTLPVATLPLRLDTGHIKSEINRILGINKYRVETDNEKPGDVVVATTSMIPRRSQSPIGNVDTNNTEAITITTGVIPSRSHSPIGNVDTNNTEAITITTSVIPSRSHSPIEHNDTTEKETSENLPETSTIESTKASEETKTKKAYTTKQTTLSTYNQTAFECITVRKTKATRRKTTRTTTTRIKLDVPALLAIIANLTYDYEMNLTDNLNATLLKYSIPTCEPQTTTAKKGLFIDYEANATGIIVAKCFVCGLDVEQIPRNAHCADAFAGDFLPLVPVDMTARGKISKYRKYCRYADVPRYMTNETQPRSVFGRWTGGCSVRWIDLSGVYTQRSCRNRERAVLGRHYASKRMAKLEMALSNVENGCISSPMATLVPLSRGISLYARFHACVCTGSWCNAADIRVPWTANSLVFIVLSLFSQYLLI